jgi:hypothetical protein
MADRGLYKQQKVKRGKFFDLNTFLLGKFNRRIITQRCASCYSFQIEQKKAIFPYPSNNF